MSIATLLLFLSLGLDTLAVALGLGLAGLPRSRWLKVGLTFAVFEGGMPVVGLLLGRSLSAALSEVAGYAAAIILLIVGLLTIREALSNEQEAQPALVADDNRRLLLAGLSVSLDEFAVGFALGALNVSLGSCPWLRGGAGVRAHLRRPLARLPRGRTARRTRRTHLRPNPHRAGDVAAG